MGRARPRLCVDSHPEPCVPSASEGRTWASGCCPHWSSLFQGLLQGAGMEVLM